MGRVLRVIGWVLGALVVIVLIAAAGVYVSAQRKLGQHFDNPRLQLTVSSTPERIERGRYLVTAFPGCAGCHSSNPAANPPVLDGSLVEDLKPIGDLYAPNLTPGGPLRDWGDGDIVRAIREGVDRDGRGLLLMPSDDYKHLSDEDVQSVVAYLRGQPPVQKELPTPRLTALGTVLVGTGQFPLSDQPPVRDVAAPARGPTAAYGRYLVETSGCAACHGPNLDAQNIPQGPPPGPSLRVVKGWTAEQFVKTLREGVDPSGHQLAETMPWRQYGKGSDDDLRALYEYLKSLP